MLKKTFAALILHAVGAINITSSFDVNKCKVAENPNYATMMASPDYRGKQMYTKSGRECMSWTGKKHETNDIVRKYPDAGLGDHKNCRNPDGHHTLWCYTTDSSKRWEECEPAPCTRKRDFPAEYWSGMGANYRGF